MAASPKYKVYTPEGEYEAACKQVETAAVIVSFLGDGATIRNGHQKRDIVWTEGEHADGDAGESYDHVAEVAASREGRRY